MTLPIQTDTFLSMAPGMAGGHPTGDRRASLLMGLWNTFLRWRYLVLGLVGAAVIAGLVVTLLMTPLYTAKTRIEISREQKNITNVQGVESQEAGRDLEFYNTQWSLLEARSLAERVARELRLSRDQSFFAAHNATPDTGASLFGPNSGAMTPAQRDKVERQVVDLLITHLAVVPIRGSALVDITYTSASPEVSARIANAWAQQFIAASMDRRMASTADARQFLEARLSDLRTRLQNSERELADFANAHDIITLSRTIGPDGKTEIERTLKAANLEALDAALANATAARIAAASRLAASGGANSDSLTNQAIGQLRERRALVAADYAKLLTQFEPQYPAALALRDELASLDASLRREEARVRATRASSYQEALRAEQDLLAKVGQLKSSLSQQQRDSIQYNIFQREVDTNRQLYDSLLQRYKEIGVSAVGANNISVIDPARAPEKPSSPKLLVNVALSVMLGLLLAAALIYVLSRIDETVRDPGMVAELLGHPLLGSTPQSDRDLIEDLQDAKSAVSEAYLSVRSNLAFLTDHGVPRSLMVTSSRPAEGKSVTALALATVLGRTGKRVLLVDADMRSPSLSGFLELANERGLSNILAGDDDWKGAVHGTALNGVNLLPSGQMPPNAAELLSTDRFAMLISQFGKDYDCVVIDTPPILGLADAPLISRTVEGCVFVAEAGRLPVPALRSSLDRLESVKARVFGIILTKVEYTSAGYGYGYGYEYGDNKQAAEA